MFRCWSTRWLGCTFPERVNSFIVFKQQQVDHVSLHTQFSHQP